LGTSTLDPLSLNKPLEDLKDLSGMKDVATSIEESIALTEELAKPIVPATAPNVTMTIRPISVPVVEPTPVFEVIASVVEAAPVEEPVVVEETIAEVVAPEPVPEPVVPEPAPQPASEPSAMPVAPPVVLIPGPPMVSYTVRSIPPALAEELKFLWTPTVMPEGSAVYVDPITYSQQAYELRKNAVDQILDNLTWE